jgi:hypothetical protein
MVFPAAMSSNKRIFIVSVSAAVLFFVALAFNACHKGEYTNISRNDFIDKLKGEWYVSWYSTDSPDVTFHMMAVYNDSLHCFTYVGQEEVKTTYSLDDSSFCTFPDIEDIQNWIITNDRKDIFLESIDLCGNEKNYQINYDNYQYGLLTHDQIFAEISLSNADTTLVLSIFQIISWPGSPDEINFEFAPSYGYRTSVHLLRREQ